MGRVGQGLTVAVVLFAAPAAAQQAARVDPATTRLAILAAEDRRAPTPRDLSIIRAGTRSGDPQTARIAVRALGRLERPELIADIVPGLRHVLPEIRAEAANAFAQAAQGWARDPTARAHRTNLESAAATLTARLTIEAEPGVRAALAEAIGRLPYADAPQVQKAERTLLDLLARSHSTTDRLGVAAGLRATSRLRRTLNAPGGDAVPALRALALVMADQPRSGIELAPRAVNSSGTNGSDPARDVRVRRLALDALIDANAAEDQTFGRASADLDPQVRRLAMRAVSMVGGVSEQVAADVLRRGVSDPSPMVRLEATQMLRRRATSVDVCSTAAELVHDPLPAVALAALDQLAGCQSSEAIALLENAIAQDSRQESARGWHRAAHAIVALASASPAKAASALPRVAGSPVWQLRMYAAAAARTLQDRAMLEKLEKDAEDNVREAAIQALSALVGHGADPIYIDALGRPGYQVLRAAAMALAGTDTTAAVAPLTAALRRLVEEGRDNSNDARAAIADSLRGLGVSADAVRKLGATPVRLKADTTKNSRGVRLQPDHDMTAADLRRLSGARARVEIRGVGTFELALIAAEAPASAFRFARLAVAGYYNGLTFHRVVPNFVIQGGSPGANEYIGDATFMRDELGQWPHVRGAVGISTRGHDTGDAQIFIDLVDIPRLDHEYTVFAHVLNGMDVVDRILEGDVIDSIEIITGQ